jgi:hypothetical protein
MKILFASLSLLLASSAGLAANPPAATAAASTPVAADAERLDLARRFVALSQPVKGLLDMMREAARSSAQAQLDPDAGEAERAELEKGIDQIFIKLEPKFAAERPAIVEAYAQAYARQFSTDELQAMVAFGASPAGQHYLSSTVDIETDPPVLKANESLSNAMMSVMDEVRTESCAKRAAERLAMGDKNAHCPLAKGDEARSL